MAIIRRIGDDVDDARRSRKTEKRALRAFEHFDPVDIKQVGNVDIALAHLIDNDPHRRNRPGFKRLGSDPPDLPTAADISARLRDLERRCYARKIDNRINLLPLELPLIHDCNGKGHILQSLGALLRGNDDLGSRSR